MKQLAMISASHKATVEGVAFKESTEPQATRDDPTKANVFAESEANNIL